MTTYVDPQSNAEKAYNVAHISTWKEVERAFSNPVVVILMPRSILGRGRLLYSPPLILKMIVVCAILHNFCVRSDVPWVEQMEDPREEDEDNDAQS
ncbi:hypothetical protein NDU88_005672 [Pleurodeles waltl]|uniref:DDE Tnp4 domain-containing protein n=1 Tax=Pleurodeles waltl TaxID=8319 RepID=A0AAV7RPQ4_PLEWA|nr:hypothetical protein NDU88_005672 [Pleurodeles waltl]